MTKICIGDSDKQKHLIAAMHADVGTDLAPHKGINRMREAVTEKYEWPNMGKDVEKYVKNCDICNAMPTKSVQKVAMELHPVKVPQHVWGMCSMDLLTLKQTH